MSARAGSAIPLSNNPTVMPITAQSVLCFMEASLPLSYLHLRFAQLHLAVTEP